MKKFLRHTLALLATFAFPNVAMASLIVASVGDTTPTDATAGNAPLVSGNVYGSAIVSPNFQAPVGACGGADDAGPTCDLSWTFSYTIPVGETITAASLTVALWDLDSVQAGSQVALFQVNDGDVLTSALNTAAEALSAVNNQYDVFTFSLLNFAALAGGSPTVHITFQAPGGGVLGSTNFNAGAILFSTIR